MVGNFIKGLFGYDNIQSKNDYGQMTITNYEDLYNAIHNGSIKYLTKDDFMIMMNILSYNSENCSKISPYYKSYFKE